jgi:phage baseplate assembly protein W
MSYDNTIPTSSPTVIVDAPPSTPYGQYEGNTTGIDFPNDDRQIGGNLAGLPIPPAGMHYMENGDLMYGSAHADSDTTPNYQSTLPVNSGLSDSFRSSRTSSSAVYSDIPLDMKIHPNIYDVRPLKDARAVQQSVKNLVLSNFTDRPFQPELGSNVTALLFEPADVGTAIALREEIIRVLTDHEPRIANVTVEVFDNSDRNAYQINIGYTIVISDTNDNTEFYLERLR